MRGVETRQMGQTAWHEVTDVRNGRRFVGYVFPGNPAWAAESRAGDQREGFFTSDEAIQWLVEEAS